MTPAASTQASSNSPVRSIYAGEPDFAELLEIYAAGLPERLATLRSTFETGNISELRTLAHQMKGSGGGFGFPGVTDRAAELETACKSQDPAAIAAKLERLLEYLGRIEI